MLSQQQKRLKHGPPRLSLDAQEMPGGLQLLSEEGDELLFIRRAACFSEHEL